MDLFGIVGKSTLINAKTTNRLYLEVILYTPVIKVVGIDNEQRDAGIRVNFFDNVQKLSELLKAGSRVSLMVSELRAQPYTSTTNNSAPSVSFSGVGLGFQYLPVNNRTNQNGPKNEQTFQAPVQQQTLQQYNQPVPQQQVYQQANVQQQQQQVYQQANVQQQPVYQQNNVQQQPVFEQKQADIFNQNELENSDVLNFLQNINSNPNG